MTIITHPRIVDPKQVAGPYGTEGPVALRRSVRELAHHLVHVILPSRPHGFTFDWAQWDFAPFADETHFVSLKGYERRLKATPNIEDVVDWIVASRSALIQPDRYTGNWPYNDSQYFDVTMPVEGRDTAFRFGQLNLQTTIYHPASRETIWL